MAYYIYFVPILNYIQGRRAGEIFGGAQEMCY